MVQSAPAALTIRRPTECLGFLRGADEETKDLILPIKLNEVFTVGTTGCDLLIDAPFITSVHCEIRSKIEDGILMAFITDKSRNGTYLNGNLIGYNETVILYPGCVISFASQYLNVFYIQSKQKELNPTYDENFSITLKIGTENAIKKKDYSISVTDKVIGVGSQADVLLSSVEYKLRYQLACKKPNKRSLYSGSSISPKTEISILKSNKHTNVLSMVDQVKRGDFTYTFCPLYAGGTLTERINKEKLMPEKDVFFIFHQIASGLHYIHQQGIIHCDLKSDNILLAGFMSRPRIVISDFGLSIYSKDKKNWPDDYGTLVYHSPEIVNRSPFTEKVDCWALGVILYQMLTKKHPFINELSKNPLKSSNIRTSILSASPDMKLLVNNSNDVKHLLTKLLTKDASNRFSTADCLDSRWVLMNCDEQFDHDYLQVKKSFKKERAFWFGDEEEEPEKKVNTVHPDWVPEKAKLLQARLSKDHPESIFRLGKKLPAIPPEDCRSLNEERFPQRTLLKRKLVDYLDTASNK